MRDFCKEVRLINETILRYMYERLVGLGNYQTRIPMAGDILRDQKFNEKVTDVELKMAAEEVQRIGNKYVHKDPKPGESESQFNRRITDEGKRLPYDAEKLMSEFSDALNFD